MPFTIGCDPELVCRRNGNFVPAYDHFRANSSFGLDGYESVAEVRPGHSESPVDITAKIKIILEYGHEKAPDLEFYSGHFQCDCPIGGHIHFSLEPNSNVLNNLDAVLYSLSNCIDDLPQRKKREQSGYCKRGAYRKQPHGFEFRFPGSFLLSPSVTLVNFTLAKLAALAWLEDSINLSDIKRNQQSKTFLKNLKNNLVTIPEDCEEGLKQLDQLIDKKLNWDQNILPLWGIN